MPAFQLRLLGPVEILDETGSVVPLPPGKPLALLIYLLVTGKAELRETLAGLFWPRSDPDRAKHSLRQAVWLLRQTFGSEAIAANHEIRVASERFATDLTACRQALDACRVEEVLGLWRGPFLERFGLADAPDWEHWADGIRNSLDRPFAHCLVERAADLRRAGDLTSARQYLERATFVYPEWTEGWTKLFELLVEIRDLNGARALLARVERFPPDIRPDIDLDGLRQRLERVRSGLSAQRQKRAFQVEFVGRTREYADLVALWRQARKAETRLGLVLGPTGVGKTRLVTEVARVAAADGAVVVEVKAREAERPLEGALLAELVEKLIVLRGAAGISAGSERILHSVLPQRASDGVVDLHPTAAASVADALADLLDAVAHEGPLVLVIDDLQWADAPSRSMLSRAFRRTVGAACLFLVTCRTDDRGQDTGRLLSQLETETTGSTIRLSSLTRAETRELVTLLIAFPEAKTADQVVDRLHSVTDGNPLFLVELLETLQERQVLEWAEGGWQLVPERIPAEFPLPPSLAAVVEERLSRLTDPAARVVQHLAGFPDAVAVDAIRGMTGLTEGRTVHALDELLSRGLVRWRAGDRIEFAHDQYRVAARRWQGPALRSKPTAARQKRVWYVVIPMGMIVVLVLGLWGRFVTGRTSPQPPAPLYGGGAIWTWPTEQEPVLLRVDSKGQWRRTAATEWHPAFSSRIVGPFRTAEGALAWFQMGQDGHDAPYVIRLLRDTEQVVVRTPGDDNAAGVSPDDRYLLYLSQDLTVPGYVQDLYLARADGSEARRLVRGPVLMARWSPDGALIAAVRRSRADTLQIITPGGRTLFRLGYRGLTSIAWCGESRHLVARALGADDYGVAAIDARDGSTHWLHTPGPVLSPLACSPDGKAVALDAAVGGAVTPFVQTLATDSATILPVDALRNPYWIPDSISPCLEGVRIVGPEQRQLHWGEQTSLEAHAMPVAVGLPDDSIVWTSLDPGIASVGPGGSLWGTGPGRTKIIATARDWHSDTVWVEVSGTTSTTALYQDVFNSPLESRWHILGFPRARVTQLSGTPALELLGDGRYADGITTRDTFDLTLGASLELDFRFHLNRSFGQRIGVCLEQSVPPEDSSLISDQSNWHLLQNVCATYPGAELEKFDSTGIAFTAQVGTRYFPVPELPTDDWVHLSMDLQADGTAALYLNQKLVGYAPCGCATWQRRGGVSPSMEQPWARTCTCAT